MYQAEILSLAATGKLRGSPKVEAKASLSCTFGLIHIRSKKPIQAPNRTLTQFHSPNFDLIPVYIPRLRNGRAYTGKEVNVKVAAEICSLTTHKIIYIEIFLQSN